jgi:hypothetical protein
VSQAQIESARTAADKNKLEIDFMRKQMEELFGDNQVIDFGRSWGQDVISRMSGKIGNLFSDIKDKTTTIDAPSTLPYQAYSPWSTNQVVSTAPNIEGKMSRMQHFYNATEDMLKSIESKLGKKQFTTADDAQVMTIYQDLLNMFEGPAKEIKDDEGKVTGTERTPGFLEFALAESGLSKIDTKGDLQAYLDKLRSRYQAIGTALTVRRNPGGKNRYATAKAQYINP